MTCYHPLRAYQAQSERTSTGKLAIYFRSSDCKGLATEIKLPCGQCIGCRIDRSRDWALRCVHEASLYSANCFVTLTFNDYFLDSGYSIDKTDFPQFMKRLRKKYIGFDRVGDKYPIRYYHCAEYGEHNLRPHHHACIFNFDFQDKVLWNIRDGVRLYRSESLERLWSRAIPESDIKCVGKEFLWTNDNGILMAKMGHCLIGDVTWQSAAYCARYIVKKITGKQAEESYRRVDEETGEVYQVIPEYCTMSRRPGIGRGWYDAYVGDAFPKDFLTHDGKRLRVPRYYDRLYDIDDPQSMETIKKRRVQNARKHVEDQVTERLLVKKKCKEAKVSRLKRSL